MYATYSDTPSNNRAMLYTEIQLLPCPSIFMNMSSAQTGAYIKSEGVGKKFNENHAY